MQEEIEHKAVALIINGTKMTGQALKKAISAYLKHLREQTNAHNRAHPQSKSIGKQSVKKLIGQGQGVTTIEITDGNIKSFEHVARKYGVDYALKKDMTGEIPRYLVFFKARDTDALTAAFKEYAGKTMKREKAPSALEQLHKAKEVLKASPQKANHKEPER